MRTFAVFACLMFTATLAEANPKRCATPQVARASADEQLDWFAGDTQRVLYLNRFGGTYTISNGATDSATNTANAEISQGPTGKITISPMESSFDWAKISTCVREHYAKYNIRVVESEPKDVDSYVEAVVGGDGTELGFQQGELFGVASADNFCSVTEKGIAFSFSATHLLVQPGTEDDELCATIAHEVGHLLALEHETLATDLLSYVLFADSHAKRFESADSSCGVAPGQEDGCSCQNTGNKTNSDGRLTQFIGTKPTGDGDKPALSIVSPSNNETVSSYFEVVAKATDSGGMADVRVLVDGVEKGNAAMVAADGYPVEVRAGGDGMHTLEVIARDLAGNETTAMVKVTSRAGELGDSCVADESCKTAECATIGSDKFCSQACDATNVCPDGFTCDATAKLCAPASDGGGCCSVGDDHGVAAMGLGLGIGAILLRRRRR